MGRHSRGDDPAHGRPESGEPPTGYGRAGARPGEAVGAFPVRPVAPSEHQNGPGRGATVAPGVPTDSPRMAGETSGYRPGGQNSGYSAGEATGARRAVAGEAAGYRRANPPAGRPGEATGSRPFSDYRGANSPGETTGSRRAVPAEATGSRRAISDETSGYRRRVGSESTGSRRAVTVERAAGSTGGQPVLTAESTRRIQGGTRRAGAGETTGSHRVAPPGETTGSHRVLGEAKRGIAKWPIVAGVFVVLLVLGLLGWGWADSVVNNRAEAQASACAEGDSNLSVVAAPSVAPAVTTAADRWNQARTVVHSHCVHVQVQAIDDQRALLALTGRGNLDSIGGQPAVWIPQNTAAITELTNARPTLLTSRAESLATTAGGDYPCAVLTSDAVDEVQQRAAQVFRNFLQEPAQKADFAHAPGA